MKKGYLKEHLFEIFFFAIIALVLLLKLGASSLWEPDEPRYAEAVREMIERDDFLTPRYNYEFRFDKPIFYYWLIAGSFKIFGMNDFGLRFPSALLSFFTILLVYLLAKRIYNRATATCSTIVLATMFNYIKLGRYAIPDAAWIFFITAAFYFFASGLKNQENARFYMPAGYSMIALASITKSPVGALIPALVFLIYMLVRRDWTLWAKMRVNQGILIFVLIALPWFLYMIVKYKSAYLNYYLVSDHFKRFFTYEFGRPRPFWYYCQILLGDFLPWTLFFLLGLFNKLLRWKNITSRKNENFTFLLLLWGLVVLIVFSLSGTKLPHYISPAYPPLAILTSIYIGSVITGEKRMNKSNILAQFLVVLTSFVAGILLIVHTKFLIEEKLATGTTYLCGVILILTAIILTYLILRKHFDYFVKTVGIGLMAAFISIIVLLLPVYEKTIPVKDISLFLKQIIKTQDKIALYKTINPAVMYYLHRKVIDINTADELEKFLTEYSRVFVITKGENIYDFENNIKVPFYEILRKTRYLPRFDNFYKKPKHAASFELVLFSNKPLNK